MVDKVTYYSMITKGHLADGCRYAIADILRSLNGKTVEITIKEQKKVRSLKQNAYYFGYVLPPIVNLFQGWGNNVNAEQVHEYLKKEVGKLTDTLILPDGETDTYTLSSADLSTIAFEEYLQKVRMWAQDWDLIIPLPNETPLNL
jgi:hypothetical protein